MEEKLLTKKLMTEVRDRVCDGMAAVDLLKPLVKEKGSQKDRIYLEAISKSLHRLLRLIRHVDACDVQSIDEKRTLDLAGLYRKVGRDGEDIAKLLGTDFSYSQPTDSSVISHGDDYLLEMAILNLMANAFEAAGPAGKVRLGGKLEKDRWIVTVEDDGPGLPTPEAEENPFLKTHSGVGLGVDTARKIAELHGGVLVLNSAAGGGVQAVLSIPVKKPKSLGGGEGIDVTDVGKAAAANYMTRGGGFSAILLEFSHLLPGENFFPDDMN